MLAEAMPGLVSEVVIGVLAIPHCASHLCCDDALQAVRASDPRDPVNMLTRDAFE